MGMFLEESGAGFRPRVLEVQLGGAQGEVFTRLGPWTDPDPLLARIATLGGSALSLAMHLARVRRAEPCDGIVLAVGCAVRRRLPTAARATLGGISPLTGLYAESQVGSELAARLVQVADGLHVHGRFGQSAGACLVIDGDGAARIERLPELDPLSLPERCAFLRERFPQASGLCTANAGEVGVPFASLATLTEPPSYTGRGGLGARLGGMGLSAVLLELELAPEGGRTTDWSQALADSPHLQARGLGGTLELRDAFAARGDLPARSGASFRDTLASRQSCPGCPTACRHILKTGGGSLAGRFSALHPLGEALGLTEARDSLALLEACNAVGVDAGETGAALGVLVLGGPQPGGAVLRGNVQGLIEEVQDIPQSTIVLGSVVLARVSGLRPATPVVRSSAIREVSDLAALLGQCVSLRGSDPLRSFPFLAENGGDERRLARLVAPLELPPEAFDGKHPAGKGRLVWWHENLANVVDASGFCAFSAAGLLGDGFGDLDDLARWLELPGVEPNGNALQALGASLVLLQRELAQSLGDVAGADVPEWFEARAAQPGMWDEYCAVRGLDEEGRVLPWARQALGTLALLHGGVERLKPVPASVAPKDPAPARAPGKLELRASGPLASALGEVALHACEMPLSVAALLRLLAERHPSAALWLWRDGDCATSVYRAGARLAHHELLRDGDSLDLVVAISGG